MVLFFCLTTLQNWQNCPAALTNHSGFLSIQLGFFRTSRGGANTNKEKRFETIYTQGTSLSIVVDTETGVNYLVHDTGITPLLDKNGTVVITEINK